MALTRRQFLHRSAAAAAVIGLPQVAAPSVLGANDAIRVGVAGLWQPRKPPHRSFRRAGRCGGGSRL